MRDPFACIHAGCGTIAVTLPVYTLGCGCPKRSGPVAIIRSEGRTLTRFSERDAEERVQPTFAPTSDGDRCAVRRFGLDRGYSRFGSVVSDNRRSRSAESQWGSQEGCQCDREDLHNERNESKVGVRRLCLDACWFISPAAQLRPVRNVPGDERRHAVIACSADSPSLPAAGRHEPAIV